MNKCLRIAVVSHIWVFFFLVLSVDAIQE